jgi:predicted GNAT family acetyltransferase
MADQIRATPRSPILGLFSDLVNLPLQYMSSPERTQQMQGTAQFLYGTGIPKTLERASYVSPDSRLPYYGFGSLFSGAGGLGGTAKMRPETSEALMTVAPVLPVAGRVSGRMIKATEGMPVGMSIKDVGKSNINVQLNEGSNFLSAKSEFGQVGGTIRQPDRLSDTPYLQINYAEVEKASRGKGKGKELYQALIDEAQTRGLRVFSDSTVEKPAVNVYKSLEKGGYKLNDMTTGSLEDGTVYGAGASKPAFEIISTKSIQAPQQAASPVGATGLPSPQSLTMPSVPTVEQMQKYGRIETVPLSKAVSFQSARDWGKFNAKKGAGDLVAGYGDKPLALRLETGEYVIYDGNHRTDLALQKGLTELPMNVIDVKSYDPTHAGRKPVPPSMTDDELLNSLLGNEVQAPRQVPQEISPTFTDPFGNTIGSSIR